MIFNYRSDLKDHAVNVETEQSEKVKKSTETESESGFDSAGETAAISSSLAATSIADNPRLEEVKEEEEDEADFSKNRLGCTF